MLRTDGMAASNVDSEIHNRTNISVRNTFFIEAYPPTLFEDGADTYVHNVVPAGTGYDCDGRHERGDGARGDLGHQVRRLLQERIALRGM